MFGVVRDKLEDRHTSGGRYWWRPVMGGNIVLRSGSQEEEPVVGAHFETKGCRLGTTDRRKFWGVDSQVKEHLVGRAVNGAQGFH